MLEFGDGLLDVEVWIAFAIAKVLLFVGRIDEARHLLGLLAADTPCGGPAVSEHRRTWGR